MTTRVLKKKEEEKSTTRHHFFPLSDDDGLQFVGRDATTWSSAGEFRTERVTNSLEFHSLEPCRVPWARCVHTSDPNKDTHTHTHTHSHSAHTLAAFLKRKTRLAQIIKINTLEAAWHDVRGTSLFFLERNLIKNYWIISVSSRLSVSSL